MKFSEQWLHEWVNPNLAHAELSTMLTMAGLEVEEVAPVSSEFTGVVVGKVLAVEKHPEADRLQVCTVDVGKGEPLTIVCGAKNVKVGMKAPTALEGAILANDLRIKRSKIRGCSSQGMLCSAMELGLSQQSEGLLVLPHDAPIGENVWDYLKLNDFVFDVAITPNRGDCLSIKGIAQEVSALSRCQLHVPNIQTLKSVIDATLPVSIKNEKCCPRYVGRILRGIKADVITPTWMQERLRRSGIRSISPIVDVMNYVMLELGQPMHAFDYHKIDSEIQVRLALPHEQLTLLDGQTVNLTADTLIIADKTKPLAIAGVMGGLDSGVTLLTENIFLESAYFDSATIAATVQRFKLGSESSYRFERGIDPTLQVKAMERATELLLEIVGGEIGPIIEKTADLHLPKPKVIELRKDRVNKILGLTLQDKEIEQILQRLDFKLVKENSKWQVTVPPRRSDINIEEDLIEEIARLHGYAKLPVHSHFAEMQIHSVPDNKLSLNILRRTLCDLGYNEVITYSFIDKKLQGLFAPNQQAKELVNPITSEMTVMRTTLWPGLINTLLYNQNRQQSRIRIFEIGLRFILQNGELLQQRVLSGLISGTAFPEQWGITNRNVDFYDLKGDLESIIKLTFLAEEFFFKSCMHPALHPGQAAEICRGDLKLGVLGALHPSINQQLDIPNNVFLFEILLDELEHKGLSRYNEISKFPEIRRDIAILVDRTVPSQLIQDTIKGVAGNLLRDLYVFDVYQGKGITKDRKSIALALTLQHPNRTLRDEEVTSLMENVIGALKEKFTAELRG